MKRDFFDAAFQVPDSEGRPLSGGLLYFYRAGTSELKDTWSDSDLTVVNANPVVLDARGKPESGGIFLNGDYKVVLHDEDGVIQWSRPSVNPVTATVGGGGGNDGGWNFDNVTGGEPDGLEIAQFVGASHEIVDDESFIGTQSLKVVSTGNGGATIETSAFQPVISGQEFHAEVAHRASAVGARCTLEALFYDRDLLPLSPQTVIDNEDVPLAWKREIAAVEAPEGARFFKWRYTAIDPTTATLANTVWLGQVVARLGIPRTIRKDVTALQNLAGALNVSLPIPGGVTGSVDEPQMWPRGYGIYGVNTGEMPGQPTTSGFLIHFGTTENVVRNTQLWVERLASGKSRLYFRYSNSETAWQAWQRFLSEENINAAIGAGKPQFGMTPGLSTAVPAEGSAWCPASAESGSICLGLNAVHGASSDGIVITQVDLVGRQVKAYNRTATPISVTVRQRYVKNYASG